MSLAFFAAFFAFLWLIGLPAYWLLYTTSQERKGAYEKLQWYRKQPLWPHGVLKVAFIALNAWALFPIRGALVAIGVIALFLVLQQ